MLKIPIQKAEKFSKISNKFSYDSNPYTLAFSGFYENNEELLIYQRDPLYMNDFPFLSLPKNKKHWIRGIFTDASQVDIEMIKNENIEVRNSFVYGPEYYYNTQDFIDLSVSNKTFRKHVNNFKNNYEFKIKNSYPQKKILEFLDKWTSSQKEQNELFDNSNEFEKFCIKMCKVIKGKWLFIEVDKELVGYCLSYQFNKDFWVGIHQKVDYNYKGLSRFLLHKRASLFPNTSYFSLGTGARDEGIKKFKEELRPFKKEDRYYIITGNRL